MTNYEEYPEPMVIRLADKSGMQALGSGDVVLLMENGSTITLKSVLHLPGLSINLLSVKTATDRGFQVAFTGNKCTIKAADKQLLATGTKYGGLYLLNVASAHLARPEADGTLWHRRFGHANTSGLTTLAKKGLIRGLPSEVPQVRDPCCTCLEQKAVALPYREGVASRTSSAWSVYTLMCAGPFPCRPPVGRGTTSPSWMTSHATYPSTSCTQRTRSSLPTYSGRPSWNAKRASW